MHLLVRHHAVDIQSPWGHFGQLLHESITGTASFTPANAESTGRAVALVWVANERPVLHRQLAYVELLQIQEGLSAGVVDLEEDCAVHIQSLFGDDTRPTRMLLQPASDIQHHSWRVHKTRGGSAAVRTGDDDISSSAQSNVMQLPDMSNHVSLLLVTLVDKSSVDASFDVPPAAFLA